MKIRTLLLSCIAIVLTTATAFGQVAKDAKGNCSEKDAGGDYLCSAKNSGHVAFLGDNSVYNLLEIAVQDTGNLTNIGDVSFYVCKTQFLKVGDWALLEPGKSMALAPFDNNLFSHPVYAVLIGARDQAPQVKVRIHLNPRNAKPMTCNEECNTRWNGCHQGCALDPHTNALCKAGCDTAQAVCLSKC